MRATNFATNFALMMILATPVCCCAQAIQSLTGDRPAKPADPQPETMELTVTPMAAPVPALRRRFWPAHHELENGDAQRFYLRAVILLSQGHNMADRWQQYAAADEGWASSAPLTDEQLPQAKKWLDSMPLQPVLGELRRAAQLRNNSLRLDVGERPLAELFAVLLPEIQEMRSVARLLHVEIRVLIKEGRYDEAVERIRLGFRLGGAFADEDFLVSRLVGAAISGIMLSAAQQLAAAPNAPNLYWALATLPRPLAPVDSSARIELENIKRLTGDQLKHTDGLSPAQWNAKVVDLLTHVTTLSDGRSAEPTPRYQAALAVTLGLAVTYPRAKAGLRAAGYSAAEIERMSAAEAVLRWTDWEVQRMADELQKWTLLPERIRQPYLDAGDEQLKQYIANKADALAPAVVVGLLMPAVNAALQAEARVQMHADLLQTVEAIRAHAAAAGEFPASLEKLAPLPALLNPRSGTPFSYRLEDEGKTAVVSAEDSPNHWANRIYKIQLRAAK